MATLCTTVPCHWPAHQPPPPLRGRMVSARCLPFLAGRRVRLALAWQWAARGPLTDTVSLRTTEPNAPVATGMRKRRTKCVWGVPDPGLTVTRVVGPRVAAVA